MIVVTAAIIEKDGKVLLTQRKLGTNQELKWEFPGGKMEENESPQECLIREIKEELNINIEVFDVVDVVYYKYPSITILLIAYKCNIIGGNIEAVDCNNYEWVTLDELEKYDLAEADKYIVNKLYEK